MAQVGSLSVGLKRMELWALTGCISQDQRGVLSVVDEDGEVHVAYDPGAGGANWLKVAPGDRVNLFWAVPLRGQHRQEESGFIASNNLETGKVSYYPRGLAALVLPPMNNAMGITAIFLGVFSAASFLAGESQGVGLFLLCIGYFVWTQGRVKKLKRAIETISARLKTQTT